MHTPQLADYFVSKRGLSDFQALLGLFLLAECVFLGVEDQISVGFKPTIHFPRARHGLT